MQKPLILFFILFFLAGCAGTASPQPLPTDTATPSPTKTFTLTLTITLTPTLTLTPTVTTGGTPPALPGVFQTTLQNPVDPPHTYISNACQYLHDKWSSNNSAPGTIVMSIMFHGIEAADVKLDVDEIHEKQFTQLMGDLESHGFKAITTAQLLAFLEHNAKIPQYSVLLVADDRHAADYYNQFFRPWWVGDKWPVVAAWISSPKNSADLWKQEETLNAEGWVDYEAHGVVHFPILPDSTDAYIQGELQGSIDAFKQHFNKVPIAFFWPGGNFTIKAIRMARQLGYQMGFTATPRGPLMFNWIPLGDEVTPIHPPTWVPEGPMNDPLMVLPRYWDTDADKHLEDVVKISQGAAAYAEQNKATEEEYYDIVCAPSLGPLP